MSNLRTLTKSARWETTYHGMIVHFSFLFSFICFWVLFYFIILNLEFCITFILTLHSAFYFKKGEKRKIKTNRESRWSVPGGVPLAQINPRDHVADASASHGNNGLPRDRVTHAAAWPRFRRQSGAHPKVLREWCWICAERIILPTRPHDPRDRVIFL